MRAPSRCPAFSVKRAFFDGVDDFIEIEGLARALEQAGSWTMEYLARAAGSDHPLIGVAVKQGRSTHALADEDWHYFATTFDGTNLRFYRDGLLQEEFTDTGDDFFETIVIGREGDSYESGFLDELKVTAGVRDEARIFARWTALRPTLVRTKLNRAERDTPTHVWIDGYPARILNTRDSLTVRMARHQPTTSSQVRFLTYGGETGSYPQSQIHQIGYEVYVIEGERSILRGAVELRNAAPGKLTLDFSRLQMTAGSLVNALGAQLEGDGSVDILAAAMTNEGTIGPGTSPGSLAFNDLPLGPDGFVDMEIAGLVPGSQYDQINVAGTLTMGGHLNVSLTGFTPDVGDTFDLFTFTSAVGNFNTISLPFPGGGLAYQTSLQANAFVLEVVAGPVSPPQLFVSDVGQNQIITLDAASGTVNTAIGVGNEPRQAAPTPGGAKLYVPNTNSGTVSVIDTNSNMLLTTIPGFSEPKGVAFNGSGSEVWISNVGAGSKRGAGTISFVDTASDTITGATADPCMTVPAGLVYNAFADETYSIDAAGQVCVWDTSAKTVTSTIPLGGSPQFGALTPDGTFLYVSSLTATVYKIDTLTKMVVPINLGTGISTGLATDGLKVMVATQSTDLALIDVLTDIPTAINFPSAGSLFDVALAGTRAFITDETNAQLRALDLLTYTPDPLVTPLAGATPREITANTVAANPPGTLQFSLLDYQVPETDSGPRAATLQILRVGGSAGTINARFMTQDLGVGTGFASADIDYQSVDMPIVFLDGDTTPQSVSVVIIDDRVIEGDEIAGLLLVPDIASKRGGSLDTATLTIQDVEEGTLDFTANVYQTSESAGSVTLTVTRSNGDDGLVQVNFQTVDGGAQAGSDFTFSNGTLTFPDGVSTPQDIVIPITSDSDLEGTESFQVLLDTVTNNAAIGPNNPASVDIADSPGTVVFDNDPVIVNEGDGNALIGFQRIGGSGGMISVNFTTADGTAMEPGDYTETIASIDFLDGELTQSVMVPIIDDLDTEPNETVNLSLMDGLNTVNATLVILDNDGATNPGMVRFNAPAYPLPEADNVAVLLERVGGTDGLVTFTLEAAGIPGGATPGVDFDFDPVQFQFADGDADPITVVLNAIDDNLPENDEDFTLNLTNPTGGLTLGNPATATVTIIDDDQAAGSLQLSAAQYNVAEPNGTVTVNVTRTGGTDGMVAVTLNTVPLPGEATPEDDYTPTTTQVTFNDGQAGSMPVQIPIIDDAQPEGNEDFQVALSNPVGGAAIGPPATATVTILDDEQPESGSFRFETASVQVAEDAGNAVLRVLRVGGSGGAASVTVSTVAGSAEPGDYGTNAQTITFANGDAAPRTVFVPIINDDVPETRESFEAVLGNPTGGAGLAAPNRATIEIFDNDTTLVRWQTSSSPLSETERVLNIVAELDSPSDARIFVDVAVTGSARRGTDYVLNNPSLVFMPGATTSALSLRLIDDNLVEPPESIGLTLRPRNAAAGSPSSHNISIQDNDLTEVNWVTAQRTIVEGRASKANTTVSVQARLAKPVQGGVTFPVTASGSASAGSDYQLPTPSSVSFGDGETVATYNFLLLDDNLEELLENLTLQLGAADGIATGQNNTFRAFIQDNDPPFAFWPIRLQSVLEDDTDKRAQTLNAEVRLTNPSTRRLIVPYVVAGNASFGSDHDLSAGELVFEPGQTSAFLGFQILGDLIEEHNEVLLINLIRRDVRVVNGPRRVHAVRIRDNDSGLAPQTVITSPRQGSQWLVGHEVSHSASGTDPQGDNLQFNWEICSSTGDCFTTTGADLGGLSFPAPGRYIATCIASDESGNEDLTPSSVAFDVRQSIPPQVTIVSPDQEDINITPGTHVAFTGEVAAGGSEKQAATDLAWYLIGNPKQILATETNYERTFNQAGDFTLVFQARDGSNRPGRDFINIHVADTMPVVLNIASPSEGQVIQVGEAVAFQGLVTEGATKAADLRYFWVPGDGSGNVPGQNPSGFIYDTPGRYLVRFVAVDEAGMRYRDAVSIEVRDPAAAPLVDINLPTDLAIEPGGPGKRAGAGTVFLTARTRNGQGYGDLRYFWEINGERLLTRTPGRRTFTEPGVYTISLFAVTPDGMESETVSRTITVRETDDADFEPNNLLADAAEITSGVYDNLVVDDDYFRIEIPQDGQLLRLKLEAEEAVRVEVFNQQGDEVASREIPGRDNLQIEGLAAGDYIIRVLPGATAKGKTGFSYSFGVSVLDPALFFADIQVSEAMDTQLGVVNPTGSLATVSFIGYDANGNILDEIQLELEPRGREHRSVKQLFGAAAADVAWVQVDADGEVTGYARTESRDRKEVYAVSANPRLSSELFVPHIAERTEQWFTRAAVINGGDDGANSMILTPGDSGDLFLDQAFVKDSFDFLDRFGGNLPQGAVWATFKELNENPVLAGTEIFGLLDPEDRVIAGLSLADARSDNPNFTYISNNLYFTHISRDPNFFTGLALVNIGTSTQGVILHAYGDEGLEVGDPTTILLDKDEKIVRTADDLLAGIAEPDQVDWILIEADLDVVGYELFGTMDNTSLAGLEASTALRSELCYPFIDSDAAVAHGISVINVNPFDIVVTFTLYEDNGFAIGSVDIPLNSHEKFIGIIGQMFSQELNGANRIPGWMGAEGRRNDGAPAPLAGFELFIKDEQMGAVIAQ